MYKHYLACVRGQAQTVRWYTRGPCHADLKSQMRSHSGTADQPQQPHFSKSAWNDGTFRHGSRMAAEKKKRLGRERKWLLPAATHPHIPQVTGYTLHFIRDVMARRGLTGIAHLLLQSHRPPPPPQKHGQDTLAGTNGGEQRRATDLDALLFTLCDSSWWGERRPGVRGHRKQLKPAWDVNVEIALTLHLNNPPPMAWQ